MPLNFCQTDPPNDTARAFVDAVLDQDASRIRELLSQSQWLTDHIDEPWFYFDSPALVQSKTQREIVDVLLEFGADINVRSRWWAGSWGVLDHNPRLSEYLISRGANVDVHAAAGLGDLQRLAELLDADPSLITSPGGDGQHPLHFSRSPDVVDFLVERGAELDARDLDHSATPAQWNVNNPDVCRRLLHHRATPDVFLAAALDDVDLLQRVVEAEPDALSSRVGACCHTRPVHEASHNHIYFWKLHGASSPLRVAREFNAERAADWLFDRSPVREQFGTACWYADEPAVQSIVASHPDLPGSLPESDQKLLAEAAWDGRLEAVRLMLDVGFDPHVRGDEQSTPLDRAAFHGHREIIELLLERDPQPPLTWKNQFGGTPLGACVYGSVHGWKKDTDYPGSVRALLRAGAEADPSWLPCANPAVDAVLRESEGTP